VKKNWIILGGVALVVLLGVVLWKVKKAPAPRKPVVASEKKVKDSQPDSFDALSKQAAALEAQGELLKAQEALKTMIQNYAARPGIDEIQKRLDDLNLRILVSGLQVEGKTTIREVKEGDSLSMIADEFRTTIDFIKKQNGLSTDVIRPYQKLRIWTGRLSVYVDKSQNILLLKSDGEVIKTYRVSTGKDNITPVGSYKVVNKLKNPAWTHEGRVIAAGDPENILGTRWLGFDIPGYGIHGTTHPESIGTQATAGCVRMHNNEVEELYDLLPVNTEVTIAD
jgi:LysM repeat protein